MNNCRFFFHLIVTSIKASMSLRGAFIFEVLLMLVNDLIFVAIWWIFFQHFQEIDGWQMRDMAALIAIGGGSYGLMQIFFGGTKHISQIIINGDLDPFMTQPKNILLHVLASRSLSRGWGHLLNALVLVILVGFTDLYSLSILLVGLFCGCLIFVSVNVIAHSLSFWIGSTESLARKYSDALILFSMYPTNIYSGILEIIMFTLIPAGVISFLPVNLLRVFSLDRLLILLGSAFCFTVAAFIVFYLGLRRYESGNQFGTRV